MSNRRRRKRQGHIKQASANWKPWAGIMEPRIEPTSEQAQLPKRIEIVPEGDDAIRALEELAEDSALDELYQASKPQPQPGYWQRLLDKIQRLLAGRL